jgi:exosome complex RNA-binding protein Rrp4
VFGLDILLEAEENIRIVRENLKTVQSRQRSYADTRRRELNFEVGDYVYLKVHQSEESKDSEPKAS